MVDTQLVARGVRHCAVLDAMRCIPRERFVPTEIASRAYEDAALPGECGQTISQPFMVARMSELLEPDVSASVLEIGTGTGYQTAILARLFARVYTIEWHLRLMAAARERLERLECTNVTYRCSDGSLGWPDASPFDAILLTAGAPRMPEVVRDQLAAGGRLVAPIGPETGQTLVRVRRGESGFKQEALFQCRFVKLWGAQGWRD